MANVLNKTISRKIVCVLYFIAYFGFLVCLTIPILDWPAAVRDVHLTVILLFPSGLAGLAMLPPLKVPFPGLLVSCLVGYAIYAALLCAAIRWRRIWNTIAVLILLLVVMLLNIQGCEPVAEEMRNNVHLF